MDLTTGDLDSFFGSATSSLELHNNFNRDKTTYDNKIIPYCYHYINRFISNKPAIDNLPQYNLYNSVILSNGWAFGSLDSSGNFLINDEIGSTTVVLNDANFIFSDSSGNIDIVWNAEQTRYMVFLNDVSGSQHLTINSIKDASGFNIFEKINLTITSDIITYNRGDTAKEYNYGQSIKIGEIIIYDTNYYVILTPLFIVNVDKPDASNYIGFIGFSIDTFAYVRGDGIGSILNYLSGNKEILYNFFIQNADIYNNFVADNSVFDVLSSYLNIPEDIPEGTAAADFYLADNGWNTDNFSIVIADNPDNRINVSLNTSIYAITNGTFTDTSGSNVILVISDKSYTITLYTRQIEYGGITYNLNERILLGSRNTGFSIVDTFVNILATGSGSFYTDEVSRIISLSGNFYSLYDLLKKKHKKNNKNKTSKTNKTNKTNKTSKTKKTNSLSQNIKKQNKNEKIRIKKIHDFFENLAQ